MMSGINDASRISASGVKLQSGTMGAIVTASQAVRKGNKFIKSISIFSQLVDSTLDLWENSL
ncbi:hypothetical protein ACIQ7N_19260 [Lysinibacillus sp. NPDC095746]|uniref:hypothetical protein n=1 Tax=Lysinibacillus sp. NPDC095746 TaxID=3364134 RepID=UPI0037FBE895